MIHGVVDDRLQPLIVITVLGPLGISQEVEAVIDTGVNGFLSLPLQTVAALGLGSTGRGTVVLADGSRRSVPVYEAEALWERGQVTGPALAVDGRPLIGCRLLRDCQCLIDFVPGSRVLITAVPTTRAENATSTGEPATSELTPEDVGRIGEAIYRRDIRDKVMPQRKGKFLVLDIHTGEYEVDERDVTATERLLARVPGAVTYGVLIGYVAAYGFAGAPPEDES